MSLYNDIINKKEKIAVIGLGYVGMPIAISFAKTLDVIGFDVNVQKINLYKSGVDPTNEVGDEEIKNTKLYFTSDEKKIAEAKFHIVAVPTPINIDKTPDLSPVIGASEVVGRNLTKGSIVVYESTVYPGVTEDVCIPILEKQSNLKCGVDFYVGYSPERINPGDKEHRLENIVKVVSGMNEYALEEIASIYEIIIKAGVHRAKSIKVAEACKVVENSQRDINIAFMNELAMVFDKMNINTKEVIDAMNTKWNALKFYPGLVGGHCIGVDPYYFVYEAEKLGYHSQIILSGRQINDYMGKFVADAIIKKLILCNKVVSKSRVVILGMTFKENTPDTRNSKVADIINSLKEYNVTPIICDPCADFEEAKAEYNVDIVKFEDISDADCVVLAVAHDEFKFMDYEKLVSLFKDINNDEKIIVDIKSILNKEYFIQNGYKYWSL